VLGQATALPLRPRWIRSRKNKCPRWPGLRHTIPAIDTRPDPLPDTATTGV
jgi:hypothetical protein